jgi:SAM-dependent methyltransferase
MADNDQSTIWNEGVGGAWVEHAHHYDATLAPFGQAVLDRLAIQPNERIVDIGCGAGATTLDIAALAEAVTGIDLSTPMLDLARQRAQAAGVTNINWQAADVETDALGADIYDVAFSRFGVMFFPHPLLAFTNIGRSLVATGRIGFVCFQSPMANPFIIVPTMAAAQALRVPPPADPTAPSPFSLADSDTTRSLLTQAGFVDIAIEPGPTQAVLGDDHDLSALARRLIEQNPAVGPTFNSATPADQQAAIEAAAIALEPHCSEGLVKLAAATWIVTAKVAAR